MPLGRILVMILGTLLETRLVESILVETILATTILVKTMVKTISSMLGKTIPNVLGAILSRIVLSRILDMLLLIILDTRMLEVILSIKIYRQRVLNISFNLRWKPYSGTKMERATSPPPL